MLIHFYIMDYISHLNLIYTNLYHQFSKGEIPQISPQIIRITANILRAKVVVVVDIYAIVAKNFVISNGSPGRLVKFYKMDILI
jgi:hypothetical protein